MPLTNGCDENQGTTERSHVARGAGGLTQRRGQGPGQMVFHTLSSP